MNEQIGPGGAVIQHISMLQGVGCLGDVVVSDAFKSPSRLKLKLYSAFLKFVADLSLSWTCICSTGPGVILLNLLLHATEEPALDQGHSRNWFDVQA